MRPISESNALKLLFTNGKRKSDFTYGKGKYLDFVFLCGKEKQPGDNREMITNSLIETRLFRYSLYSESLFSLFSSTDLDLLSIEEILADISSKIVIIVESYGSACELGAFSFLNAQLQKLLVINDVQYSKGGSFITDGPITKIIHSSDSKSPRVLYERFICGNLVFSEKMVNIISSIERTSFERKPFFVKNNGSLNYFVIKDVGLLTCLMFEYVIRFGYLREKSIIDITNAITLNHARLPLIFELTSGNSIPEKHTEAILDILPKILCSLGLLEKKDNRGDHYYALSKMILDKKLDLTQLTSVLFSGDETKTRSFRKDISRIKNKAHQEGYLLWSAT